MALTTFTLCNHHHHPSPELFSSCKTETPYPLNNDSLFPHPWQPLSGLYFACPFFFFSFHFSSNSSLFYFINVLVYNRLEIKRNKNWSFTTGSLERSVLDYSNYTYQWYCLQSISVASDHPSVIHYVSVTHRFFSSVKKQILNNHCNRVLVSMKSIHFLKLKYT